MDKHVAVRRFGISLLAAGAALLVTSVAAAHPTMGVRSAPAFRAQNWSAPSHADSSRIILHVAACRSSQRTVAVSAGGSSTGSTGASAHRDAR